MTGDRPLLAWPLLLAAALGLGVALQAPLGTTVYGLMAFGVFHNLAELRYVLGRYGDGEPRLIGTVLALLGGVVLLRASAGWLLPVADARQGEVVLVYGSLGLVLLARPGPPLLRLGLGALVAAALAASLRWTPAHFLVLSHLHNLMPVTFLLLHQRHGRARVALACLFWGGLLPALLLSGALDPWLRIDAIRAAGPVADGGALQRLWVPAGFSAASAARVVACFSYLQWMHYFIWIFFLPRFAGPAPAGRGGSAGRLLFGRAGLVAATLITAALLPFYQRDYMAAFSVYGTLASFHALVEFPVLLALLLPDRAGAPPQISMAAR